jgi:putative ABC transport system permease protein
MLRNYLRVAFRGLLRNRFSAAINIGGLAIGMAVALLIGLWIQDELSFDKYHEHYDRIVQVLQKEKHLGKTKVWEHQPFVLLAALRTSYGAQFEHIVASVPADGFLLSAGAPMGAAGRASAVVEKKMPAKGLYMDADGPDMLTLNMRKGSFGGQGLVRGWRSDGETGYNGQSMGSEQSNTGGRDGGL